MRLARLEMVMVSEASLETGISALNRFLNHILSVIDGMESKPRAARWRSYPINDVSVSYSSMPTTRQF